MRLRVESFFGAPCFLLAFLPAVRRRHSRSRMSRCKSAATAARSPTPSKICRRAIHRRAPASRSVDQRQSKRPFGEDDRQQGPPVSLRRRLPRRRHRSRGDQCRRARQERRRRSAKSEISLRSGDKQGRLRSGDEFLFDRHRLQRGKIQGRGNSGADLVGRSVESETCRPRRRADARKHHGPRLPGGGRTSGRRRRKHARKGHRQDRADQGAILPWLVAGARSAVDVGRRLGGALAQRPDLGLDRPRGAAAICPAQGGRVLRHDDDRRHCGRRSTARKRWPSSTRCSARCRSSAW